jgi:hypothetical protein
MPVARPYDVWKSNFYLDRLLVGGRMSERETTGGSDRVDSMGMIVEEATLTLIA